MTTPEIKISEELKLIGRKIETSLSENRIGELWQNLRKRQKEIKYQINQTSFSVEIYKEGMEMKNFSPHTLFEKWAAVEVSKFEDVPDGLEELIISSGKYAVFTFKGLHSSYPEFYNYIFTKWLPTSGYRLDHRPHFEIMGANYFGPLNPESEEEVWIPIQ